MDEHLDRLNELYELFNGLSDMEIADLKGTKDIYGVPLQFGDPRLFIHTSFNDHTKRLRDVEFLFFVFSHSRIPIPTLLKVFDDIEFVSHESISRFCREHQIMHVEKDHIFVQRSKNKSRP